VELAKVLVLELVFVYDGVILESCGGAALL